MCVNIKTHLRWATMSTLSVVQGRYSHRPSARDKIYQCKRPNHYFTYKEYVYNPNATFVFHKHYSEFCFPLTVVR